jgi:hypothetical protein
MWNARSASSQLKVTTILSMTNNVASSKQLDVGSEFDIELSRATQKAVVVASAVEDLIFKVADDQTKWRMRRATAEEVEILLPSLPDNSAQHWIVTSVA